MITDRLNALGLEALRTLPDKLALHILYLQKFKRIANFKYPKTFNEKVNWRKLYQHDLNFITFTDKLSVKQKIAEITSDLYIISTLWSGDDAADIPFDTLKPPYVIKTNHGCADIIFVRTNDVNKKAVCKIMNAFNKSTYGLQRREWAYKNIQPKIFVEKMLLKPNGDSPDDYKFFVYSGRVHFIQYDTGRFKQHAMGFFDKQWNFLPVTKGYPRIKCAPPKPEHFNHMVQLAEKIGTLFDFVRVDFYDTHEGVFFGETTFYPASGLVNFYPDKWDLIFGEPWIIKQ